MLLGADPEFFITSPEGFVSASEVFPEKHEPLKPYSDRYGAPFTSNGYTKLFRDGFGVEVNVQPRSCRAILSNDMSNAIKDIRYLVKKKNPDWDITSIPTAEVSYDYIQKLPEDVKKFGCDPSFNAYSERKEFIDLNGEVHTLRYAGGHMHFGYDSAKDGYNCPLTEENKKKEAFLLVKLLDLTVGLPLSIIFADKAEFLRREFYGKAGEFRFQPWGIEYRTPSPRIWNHVVLAGLAFGTGRSIIKNYSTWKEKWDSLLRMRPSLEKDLQNAINFGDGGEDLLQEVAYFYNKSIISFLKEKGKEIFKLEELALDRVNMDNEIGYANYMGSVGQRLPGYDIRWIPTLPPQIAL